MSKEKILIETLKNGLWRIYLRYISVAFFPEREHEDARKNAGPMSYEK